ncbi:MAG: hypothetical protein IID41_18205, partial [Planctomycetes bacterium]|nr:hypothetical protein [Planctomycetota bacterium]
MHNADHIVALDVLAKCLGISQRWLRKETDAGRIPFLLASRRLMFNPEAVERILIARAKEFAEAERYETALALLQKIIQDSSGTMGTSDGRVYVPARTLAERMLASLPKEALALYRLTADPQASSDLDAWRQQHDPKTLRRVV